MLTHSDMLVKALGVADVKVIKAQLSPLAIQNELLNPETLPPTLRIHFVTSINSPRASL